MVLDCTKISENVDLIKLGERRIHLIGTAHVSRASAELVTSTVKEVKPDCVAVELCQARYQSLKNPDRWKNMDLVSVIRQGKAYVLMAQLMLVSFQKKLGDKLNVKPGAEMLAAVQAGEEQKACVLLADRDVTITLKRTWRALGFWSMLKVFFSALAGSFGPDEIQEEEIERLKSSDALDELMREFSAELPEVKRTLITERDQYLAAKIQNAPGKNVVAVVGAGHVSGIKEWLGQEIDLKKLETVPPPNVYLRSLNWLIPAIVFGLLIWGFFASGLQTSASMALRWVIVTGGFAALGSAICLAHPLTILSAFLAAPITTLHPMLASGWIAGLVEALIKKPRVSDLETIADDVASLKGLFQNRVSRVLLIMAITNLLGTVGALLGMKLVAALL